MTTSRPAATYRSDALSQERIVQAAIAILDKDGEDALTIRAIAAHFATGQGAIYHHVGGKKELLREATGHILNDATARIGEQDLAADSIRAVMVGVFDAVDAHPWVGAQIAREPSQVALLDLFELIGSRLSALDVPAAELFEATSTLVNYLLGVAAQYAAGARLARDADRTDFLASAVEEWISRRDMAAHPFMHQLAAQMVGHDDRVQFLAGIEIILEGITVRYGQTR
jgi:AcrR family transcriptional regulator